MGRIGALLLTSRGSGSQGLGRGWTHVGGTPVSWAGNREQGSLAQAAVPYSSPPEELQGRTCAGMPSLSRKEALCVSHWRNSATPSTCVAALALPLLPRGFAAVALAFVDCSWGDRGDDHGKPGTWTLEPKGLRFQSPGPGPWDSLHARMHCGAPGLWALGTLGGLGAVGTVGALVPGSSGVSRE